MVEKTEVTEEEAKAAVKEVKAKAKVTEEEAVNNQFDDKTLRLGFLRKVYAILTAQLIFTLGFVALFRIPALRAFPVDYPDLSFGLLVTSFVLVFGILIALVCCGELGRKTPWNFILLLIFTLLMGFMLGMNTSFYDLWEVALAVGVCAAITGALTLFAFQTTIDFTGMRGCLVAALVCLLIFGLVAAIFRGSRTLNLLYASIGCIVFSFFIVIDTQLMIGGKHKYSLSTEDYIFAALILYMDIINLLLFILRIIRFSG